MLRFSWLREGIDENRQPNSAGGEACPCPGPGQAAFPCYSALPTLECVGECAVGNHSRQRESVQAMKPSREHGDTA